MFSVGQRKENCERKNTGQKLERTKKKLYQWGEMEMVVNLQRKSEEAKDDDEIGDQERANCYIYEREEKVKFQRGMIFIPNKLGYEVCPERRK